MFRPSPEPNLSAQIARTITTLVARGEKLYSTDFKVRKTALEVLRRHADPTLAALSSSIRFSHLQRAQEVAPQLISRLSEDPKVAKDWSMHLAQQLASKIISFLEISKAVDNAANNSKISDATSETFKSSLIDAARSITHDPKEKDQSKASFNKLFNPLIRQCDPALLVESWKHEDVNTDRTSFDTLTALGKSALGDLYRTREFILGTVSAVKELRERFPDEQLRVADLGCGPIGLLSLVALASDDNLIVEAAELSPSSALIFENLGKKLNLESRIKVIKGDARSANFSDAFHLIISETLAPALLDESFVSIAQATRESLVEGGTFLPQQVTLEAIVASKAEMGQLPRINFSPLLDHKDSFPDWSVLPDTRKSQFVFDPKSTEGSDCSFTFELSNLPSAPCVCIRTTLQVHGDHKLDTGESMITYSRLMPLPEDQIKKAASNHKTKIKISYPAGQRLEDIASQIRFRFY